VNDGGRWHVVEEQGALEGRGLMRLVCYSIDKGKDGSERWILNGGATKEDASSLRRGCLLEAYGRSHMLD
jgi:hypothetical protein